MKYLLSSLVILMTTTTISSALINTNYENYHSTTIPQRVKRLKKPMIVDFNNLFILGIYFDYQYKNPNAHVSKIKNIDISNLKYDNIEGSIKGEIKTEALQEPIFFNETIFENKFDTEQIFSTQEFSKDIKNFFYWAVKQGINLNTTLDYEIFGLNFPFSYDSTESNSKEEITKIYISENHIKVPANKTYKVTTYLTGFINQARINLKEDISGMIFATIIDQEGEHSYQATIGSIFSVLKSQNILSDTITIINNNKIQFTGLGTVLAINNETDYNVKIEDITKN